MNRKQIAYIKKVSKTVAIHHGKKAGEFFDNFIKKNIYDDAKISASAVDEILHDAESATAKEFFLGLPLY